MSFVSDAQAVPPILISRPGSPSLYRTGGISGLTRLVEERVFKSEPLFSLAVSSPFLLLILSCSALSRASNSASLMFSNFIVLPFGEFNALLWPAFRILRCVACPEDSPSGQPAIIRSQGNRQQLPEVTGTTLEFSNGRGSITRSDEKGQINKNNSTKGRTCPVCLVSESRKQNADVVVEQQQTTQANFELLGRFMGCETKCVVGEAERERQAI
jgi:hypothetical protein